MYRIVILLYFGIMPALSHADRTDSINRSIAVGGSIVSWGLAFLLDDCAECAPAGGGEAARSLVTQAGRDSGTNELTMAYFGHRWAFADTLLVRETWRMSGAWEANASHWRAEKGPFDNLWNTGFTPLLQYSLMRSYAFDPYLEFGIGAQFISETNIGDKRKSTQFQFGSLWGAGARFGRNRRLSIGFRYWHLSNLDIKLPNNGADFYSMLINWRYR